ncbi:hypothetical protein CU103_16405 [Phyllobacterium sophorae]|uniref:Uncharacterized protein n=1 Tax=Phyllobacterium sophorae TaxID=1520277 RepID=A0A2P7B9K6_9HYPH|nr:hypothetical protein CU103_16405 [Phyllobacterium sophorae]
MGPECGDEIVAIGFHDANSDPVVIACREIREIATKTVIGGVSRGSRWVLRIWTFSGQISSLALRTNVSDSFVKNNHDI